MMRVADRNGERVGRIGCVGKTTRQQDAHHHFDLLLAGMAGAYGNVGAVVYLVLFTLVDARTFFLLLAAGAALSVLACALWLREPEGSFAEESEPEREVPPSPAMERAS